MTIHDEYTSLKGDAASTNIIRLANSEGQMVFLSYRFDDEVFVSAINECLKRHTYRKTYFFTEEQRARAFQSQVTESMKASRDFVCFVRTEPGDGQVAETLLAEQVNLHGRLLVRTATADISKIEGFAIKAGTIKVASFDLQEVEGCCAKIIKALRLENPFDLPEWYPFDYEKRIIEEYAAGGGKIGAASVAEGCPAGWPKVEKVTYPAKHANPVPPTVPRDYRKESAAILVDTRVGWRESASSLENETRALTFPEAGPRANLCHPIGNDLTVGILVSGGIAPGINAVIESIVNRHYLYADKRKYNLSIYGYFEGFHGFLRRPLANSEILDPDKVKRLSGQAGAKLRTSRADELLRGDANARYEHFTSVVNSLRGVDILYVIGGEGSMKAAHALWKISRDMNRRISVVGVPKTMDNDILWVWQSFGFLSAVQEARTALLNLHTEATSNPRLGIVQLFGSDSGFVVSYAALSSGVCDAALIPEVHFSIKGFTAKQDCPGLSAYITQKLRNRLRPECSPSGLIVMAETAIPDDALDYVNDSNDAHDIRLFEEEKEAVRQYFRDGRRVLGQTPDELRSAGLKIVSRALAKDIKDMSISESDDYWKQFRVFTNEPRHLIRSISPSVSDVVFGERLGALAVDNAMAGYTDFMVSQWLTEYVLVPRS